MDRRGFTLIELLIVVTIMGILAATILPRIAGRTEQARIKRAEAEIYGTIATALDMYELDIGRYPESLEYLWSESVPAGFNSDDYKNIWQGPYIRRAKVKGASLVDPWGRPYLYESVDKGRSYRLSSLGALEEDASDDIVYSGEVTFER